MKLLVTGGAGFIGSNFVKYWLKANPNDKIVVIDKLTYAGNLANLESIQDKIGFFHGDICDTELVDKSLNGVELIVHFAAESHVDRSVLDPKNFVMSNVVGTYTLLWAAKHKRIRFHHVSTDEVFGSLPLGTEELWTEESPYDPRSPYSATKAGSDHLVRSFYHSYGLPITISNCANNYGPFHHPEKLIPLAITNLMEGKKVPVYGRGDQVREWLHVEDHCRGIELIIKRGRVGQTYFIGPEDVHIPNLEVIKMILSLMGKSEDHIEFVKDRPGHDQRYALDCSKIKNELGFQPAIKLADGLKNTIEWFDKNENWWKDIKSGEYKKYYKEQYNQ